VVWLDRGIEPFASISAAIENDLARSKALVAFYSPAYPLAARVSGSSQRPSSRRSAEAATHGATTASATGSNSMSSPPMSVRMLDVLNTIRLVSRG